MNYSRQFKVAAYVNQWPEEEKDLLLTLAVKGPAIELLYKVPVNSQNTYDVLLTKI